MPKLLRWSRVCLAACLLLGAPLARSDSYPRQPGIDALHYTFRVTLSDANDEISAEAVVALRFVQANVTQVFLDFSTPRDGKGMTVTDVNCGSAACKYEHSGDRLAISFGA